MRWTKELAFEAAHGVFDKSANRAALIVSTIFDPPRSTLKRQLSALNGGYGGRDAGSFRPRRGGGSDDAPMTDGPTDADMQMMKIDEAKQALATAEAGIATATTDAEMLAAYQAWRTLCWDGS